MSEQPFNPWDQKMPWTDDSDASSGDDKENIHKKEADPPHDDPKKDVFSALEEKLKLPLGSTKEGLEESRQMVNRIKVNAQMLEAGHSQIKLQDSLSGSSGPITPEMLDMDRMKIREQAHQLYDIAKAFLDKLQVQINTTVDISDKMWASVASMISSVTGTLDKLFQLTIKIRQEEELRAITIQKDANEKKALSEDGIIEETPDEMNRLISFFTEEDSKQHQKELGHDTTEFGN